MERSKIRDIVNIGKWYIKGKPTPAPHIIKQIIIRRNRGNRRVLVETGTYRGDMLDSQKKYFRQIFSIELDENLFRQARERFTNIPSINIVQGDSGIVLSNILHEINEPAVFWLDGHYSGGVTSKGSHDTPIYDELANIFRHHIRSHVILIDDARCFTGENDYPTISELENYIRSNTHRFSMTVNNDVIKVKYE